MAIETTIRGNPESIRTMAAWVRDSLTAGLTNTASAIYRARGSADAGWRGEASGRFQTDMTQGAGKVDDFAGRSAGEAAMFDDVAAALQRAQREMSRIRTEAFSAGLTIQGESIAEPGPAPPAPGPEPAGKSATPQQVSEHNETVAATAAHEQQVAAYSRLQGEAEDTRRSWAQTVQELNKRSNDANKNIFFSINDIAANTTVAAAAAKHSSILMDQAKFLDEDAAKKLAHAKAIGATDRVGFYQNLDDAQAQTRTASNAVDDANKATSKGKSVGLKAGGVLAGAGIIYDITQGKPVGQAVVSGGAGFATGAATGAAIGAFGGPVGVGLGAVVGAGVGIFTSGAVDSLFENGIDAVGQAIDDGWQAVEDTGEAIWDGTVSAAKGIGNLAEDAWNVFF